MTVQPVTGYPDWQDTPQAGAMVTPMTSYSVPANQQRYVCDLTAASFGAIALYVNPTSGSGWVAVTVSPSFGHPNGGTTWQWNLTAGGPALHVLIPTWGQHVAVQLFEGTGAASFNADARVIAIPTPPNRQTYIASQNYVSTLVSIPAGGGSQQIILPYIASGRLSININASSGGSISDVELRYLGINGVWGSLTLLGTSVSGRAFYDVAIPGDSIQLYLFNSGTSAISNVYVAMWTDSD